MAKLTPMMQQYMDLKKQNEDCILLFRLGDFYEMFFEDAKIASKELDIVLTGRDCGQEERAPMCGVPHHSVFSYINRLIEKGHKVAICEQLTDPSESKGIVERGVTRIITPGTVIESDLLSEGENNFLMSLCKNNNEVGLACVDVSTGFFEIGELVVEASASVLYDELTRYNPSEIIVDSNMKEYINGVFELKNSKYLVSTMDDWAYEFDHASATFLKHFNKTSLSDLDCAHLNMGICAGGALIDYLSRTQKNALLHINKVFLMQRNNSMVLDASALRNMELTRSLKDGGKKGTLLSLLDKTKTAMGARLLRRWIEQPLQETAQINARLDAVQELVSDIGLSISLKETLSKIYDIERLSSKIAYSSANARDLLSLGNSLSALPEIEKLLSCTNSALLNVLQLSLDPLEDIAELINCSIHPDPPTGIKDGGIIKDGFNEQVDKLRDASSNGKKWISDLEIEEREATGIKNLKVGFNKVFGYYLEVTKSYYDKVPYRYERKQTLANAERYITDELKEMEETILSAEDKLIRLENVVFCEIRQHIQQQISRIQQSAQVVAQLDSLYALAVCAREYNYVRPTVDEGFDIIIEEGRHPVVEKMLTSEMFVPNDTELNTTDDRMLIITGPNMSGKSTYMRQTALIVIMAHIGSFVPAKSARIGRVDRVFTRIGASDDLASGQSTFMVEMTEVASILRSATRRSLIILDEIGRGTSTFDGLSIAWAVLEHICSKDNIGARTLFSTHYHELTQLEDNLEGVKNYRVAVKEVGDDIVFLHRITRGGSDKSFGIHVANISGIPSQVTNRAKEILSQLEDVDMKQSSIMDEAENRSIVELKQNTPINKNDFIEIVDRLKEIDLSVTTPIEALNALYSLQAEVKDLK